MERYFDKFKIKTSPKANDSHIIVNGNTRITVITPCMVRVEVAAGGIFCDEPTQAVWFRDFDNPRFEVKNGNGFVEIKTTKANFLYSFTEKKMVRIKLRDGRVVTDYYSGNLKGTCRTLDVTAGIITLGDGVCSKDGVAVLDDSKTLILTDDGKILPRKAKELDEYYFAYGYDYIGATRDLYRLTGETPLIPRYALSNWWSRYKAYTQDEYLTLMDRFKQEEIPITVATVDMDWHWVKIKEKFDKVDLIAGVATGAIAYGVLVAEKLGLPFVYVRPKPKDHGMGNQVEGYLPDNANVVVIEDLISTGGSSLKAVEAIRRDGCDVIGMVASYTYGFPVAEKAFKDAKVPLVTLTNYEAVLEVALRTGYIEEGDVATLNEWRKDPAHWDAGK